MRASRAKRDDASTKSKLGGHLTDALAASNRRELARKVLALRDDGVAWVDVARRYGYSQNYLQKLVRVHKSGQNDL